MLLSFLIISAQIAAQAIPQCSDGIDNDFDGLVDTADPDCLNEDDPLEGPCIPALTLLRWELQTSPESLTNPVGVGFALSGISGFPPEEVSEFAVLLQNSTGPIEPLAAGNHLAFQLAEIGKVLGACR